MAKKVIKENSKGQKCEYHNLGKVTHSQHKPTITVSVFSYLDKKKRDEGAGFDRNIFPDETWSGEDFETTMRPLIDAFLSGIYAAYSERQPDFAAGIDE